MLQVYRLRFAASAQRVGTEPPSFESFEADELLVVLREEDGHTIFCRRHDPGAGLGRRPHFITGKQQFKRWAEPI